jgi:hypothetical protein
MMKKFKERWKIQSNWQLTVIILVFAITGSVSAWLSKPFCMWVGISNEALGIWFTPIRLLMIFPIYQVLLVLIGFLFGQYRFFWAFEKKLLRSLKLGFLIPKK